MDSRATRQCDKSPYVYAVYWLRLASLAFLPDQVVQQTLPIIRFYLWFLPNSLVSMLTYFSMSSTNEGYIPIFSHTKLFLVDLRPNNKVVFSLTVQET